MTFLIRDAIPADLVVLRDVFRRASLSNDGDRMKLLANPDALELSDAAVNEGRTRAVVADGRIVGFATFLVAGEGIELDDLLVDPGCIRQGAGRALVKDVIAIAQDYGVRRVEVTANKHALVFYERVGFVFDHDTETKFAPAPRMHLDLAP